MLGVGSPILSINIDQIEEKQRRDLEDKQKGVQSESTWSQMKESVKDTCKAGVDKAQFAWVGAKEEMLGTDKPDIKKEDIPTNLYYKGGTSG